MKDVAWFIVWINLVWSGDVPWLVAVGANEASGGGGGVEKEAGRDGDSLVETSLVAVNAKETGGGGGGGKEAGRGGDWCWSRRQDNFLQSWLQYNFLYLETWLVAVNAKETGGGGGGGKEAGRGGETILDCKKLPPASSSSFRKVDCKNKWSFVFWNKTIQDPSIETQVLTDGLTDGL